MPYIFADNIFIYLSVIFINSCILIIPFILSSVIVLLYCKFNYSILIIPFIPSFVYFFIIL